MAGLYPCRVAITCRHCGQENPDGFRVCGMCGTPLAARPAARLERKVVTVLFCDLVGFTAHAERLDPEDVQKILAPYHAQLRQELERHGGTVEKFIGDAVMALFGAPIAREDDPERAIRAALAIREYAAGTDLELRIGITTGEALISLDADPADGEGMASGDVVNTAARLQAAAPVNGILADEATYRMTRRAIDFRPATAVRAKGKASPIPVWEVAAARSRYGTDVTHHAQTELVGRERELGLLRDALDRARYERIPQLVTIVGVPGMGKSRAVHELSRITDADAELITWRQGRCLAYGDGAGFSALSEIVKAQAGILDHDSEAVTADKLRDAIEAVIQESTEARWVETHLRPLVGLGIEEGIGVGRQAEAFAAWRRFLEALAEQRPVVLVIEDLHWADDGLLDFLDELVGWLVDVPMLIVGTARPELLERRPGWGGGKLNASTLALTPLSKEQTATLLDEVFGQADLPRGVKRILLERSEGNPLYAEQFAQLYLERGSAAESTMPETLQGILSARLDTLSSEEKEALQDGAVMGKVFWSGAVGGSDGSTHLLLALARKGFLTRQRHSSVEQETEWSFAHMLLRDVSYGQIPRAERSAKHRRAAEWIASQGRPEEHAELLAHHWGSALRLAEAAGVDASELALPVRRSLRGAGDRSYAVSAMGAAVSYYRQAVERWPIDDADRPELLFRYARAAVATGAADAESLADTALDALQAGGSVERAAEAETLLADAAWERGRRDDAYAHLDRAQKLIAGGDPSPARARILSVASRYLALAGRSHEAIDVGGQALAMADALGLDEIRAHALDNISIAKEDLGDSSGRDDLLRSIEIARAVNSPELGRSLNNLAVRTSDDGDPRRAVEILEEAIQFGARVGSTNARFARGSIVGMLLDLGRWDDALSAADRFIGESALDPHYQESTARTVRSTVRLARGDVTGADADSAAALAQARLAKDPQVLLPAIITRIVLERHLGRAEPARQLVEEVDRLVREVGPRPLQGNGGWWTAHLAGLSAAYLGPLVGKATPLGATAKALQVGDFELAADGYRAMGSRTDEAYARLLAAEQQFAEGRTREGEANRRQALDFYREVGATLYVERAEALRPAG
jgi:class 3 adenylate cyclase/tetratricopeptide (TPR) repeat protein